MPSQGPQYPVNAYNDSSVGTLSWSNFNNIKSDNATNATVTFSVSAYTFTNYLKGDNFGFSLPSTAVIDGIHLEVDRGAGTGATVRDSEVKLTKAGVIQSHNKASGLTSWSTAGPAVTMGYGNSTDLWGGTWSYTDINASGFGVVLSASGSVFIGANAFVDFIRLTVHYTVGADSYASGCPLYIMCGTPENSSTPLYTTAHYPHSGNTPLFIEGLTPSSGMPLYIYGYDDAASGIPLYLCNTISSGLPLYEYGHIRSSGITPLYLHGSGADPIATSMSLFTKGLVYPSKTGVTPLFITATAAGVGGIYNTIPLTIYSAKDPNYSLNLFVKGPTGEEAQSLNLFLCNDTGIAGSVDLFIKNAYTDANSGISLYIEAPSGTDGAIPISSVMPLFIARTSEALAGVIPLYLRTPEGQNSGTSLYIAGETTSASGIPLVMPNVYGTAIDGLRLYTHGF
jgi:hypothetical protein